MTNHISSSYTILECFGPSHTERASIDNFPFIQDVSWTRGNQFNQPIPTPLEIMLDPGLMMPMFYKGILLFSDDLIIAMREAGVDNIDCYDAILFDQKTGQKYNNYKAVNIIGVVSAADLSKSKYNAPSGSALIDTDFDSLVINEKKAHGMLIFRLAECITAIVIHDKIRRHIEKKGIKYLNFVLPEKWVG